MAKANGTNGKKQRGSTAGLKPPWKPGQSGNPKGRIPGPSITKLIREQLQEIVESGGKKITKGQMLVANGIARAVAGDEKWAKLFLDRVDPAPKIIDATLNVNLATEANDYCDSFRRIAFTSPEAD